jgi:hypothetical protein
VTNDNRKACAHMMYANDLIMIGGGKGMIMILILISIL